MQHSFYSIRDVVRGFPYNWSVSCVPLLASLLLPASPDVIYTHPDFSSFVHSYNLSISITSGMEICTKKITFASPLLPASPDVIYTHPDYSSLVQSYNLSIAIDNVQNKYKNHNFIFINLDLNKLKSSTLVVFCLII